MGNANKKIIINLPHLRPIKSYKKLHCKGEPYRDPSVHTQTDRRRSFYFIIRVLTGLIFCMFTFAYISDITPKNNIEHLTKKQWGKVEYSQGGREHLTVNYTCPQSFFKNYLIRGLKILGTIYIYWASH